MSNLNSTHPILSMHQILNPEVSNSLKLFHPHDFLRHIKLILQIMVSTTSLIHVPTSNISCAKTYHNIVIHLRKSYYLTLHLDADIVAIDYLMINLSIAVLLTHATKGEINNVLHGLLTAQNSFLLLPKFRTNCKIWRTKNHKQR